MNKKIQNNNTFITIFVVIFFSIFSKLFGLFRDIMIGAKFGTGIESDVYFTSLKSTTILFMSVGVAITTNMIPIIVEYISNKDMKKANLFSNKIFTLMLYLGIIFSILGYFILPYYLKIIAHGFNEYKFQMTVETSRIIFPSIIFIFIAYSFNSMLQAFQKFKVTAIMSLPYNIILIVYMYLFSDKYSVYGLAFFTTIGWGLQAIIQVPSILKLGYKIRIDNNIFRDSDVKKFIILMFPLLISSTVYNVNSLIDTSIATKLVEGKLSALNYGSAIYVAISQTIIYGISTVLYPKFSKMINELEKNKFKEKLLGILKFLLLILLPIEMFFISFSVPIIEFVFKRGAFDEKSVQYTAISLSCYMLGMFAFGIQDILNKVFFSFKDTRTTMKFSIISIFINIILNLVLVVFFDFAGLAIATTISTLFNAIMLYFALQKKIGNMRNIELLKFLLKLFIIVILIGIIGKIFYLKLSNLFNYLFLLNSNINIILTLFLSGILELFLFVIFCKMLRINEINDIMNMVFLKIRR